MTPSTFLTVMLLIPVAALVGSYMAARVIDRVAVGSARVQLAAVFVLAGVMLLRAVGAWLEHDRLHALVLATAAGLWLIVPFAQRLGRAHRASR